MKVFVTGDEVYPYYSVSDNRGDFYEPYEIELPDELYKHCKEVSKQNDIWQDKLHTLVKKERERLTLENSKKNGIPSKGF